MLPILQMFKSVTNLFEADQFGLIADVKAVFMGLRRGLAGINGLWRKAATAAVVELDRLLHVHRAAMKEVCSIAARLNPNLDPGTVLEQEGVAEIDAMILHRLTEFVESGRAADVVPVESIDDEAPVSLSDMVTDHWSGSSEGSERRELTRRSRQLRGSPISGSCT